MVIKSNSGSYKNRRIQETKIELNSRVEETENKVDSKDKNKIEKIRQLKDQGKQSNIQIKTFQKEKTEKMEGIYHQ